MLLFFAAMFCMVEAAAEIGMIDMLGGWLEAIIRVAPAQYRTLVAVEVLLWASAFISALLDNIPYTITSEGWVHGVACLRVACSWASSSAQLLIRARAPPLPAANKHTAVVPVIEYLAASGLGLDLKVRDARLTNAMHDEQWRGSGSSRDVFVHAGRLFSFVQSVCGTP